jgi:hypothetical protein
MRGEGISLNQRRTPDKYGRLRPCGSVRDTVTAPEFEGNDHAH